MKTPNDGGYTSLQVLLVLLLLSVMALGTASLVGYVQRPLSAIRSATDATTVMAKAKSQFLELQKQDPTPLVDSRFDPVWQLDNTPIDGWTVKIEDVSSYLNLNWINLNIIENTALRERLLPGKSPAELQQYREDSGYNLDLATSYKDFFAAEDIKALFTPWGPANINIGYEEALDDLYRFRLPKGGDHTGFRTQVINHLTQKKLWTAEELQSVFGPDAPKLLEFITVEPAMNVNFMPEEIIKAVVTYPYPDGALPNASAIANIIVTNRGAGEINQQGLASLFHFTKEQQKRILAYLGVRTWVWKLTITKENQNMSLLYRVAIKKDAK